MKKKEEKKTKKEGILSFLSLVFGFSFFLVINALYTILPSLLLASLCLLHLCPFLRHSPLPTPPPTQKEAGPNQKMTLSISRTFPRRKASETRAPSPCFTSPWISSIVSLLATETYSTVCTSGSCHRRHVCV